MARKQGGASSVKIKHRVGDGEGMMYFKAVGLDLFELLSEKN